jgi:hypothetical protein
LPFPRWFGIGMSNKEFRPEVTAVNEMFSQRFSGEELAGFVGALRSANE